MSKRRASASGGKTGSKKASRPSGADSQKRSRGSKRAARPRRLWIIVAAVAVGLVLVSIGVLSLLPYRARSGSGRPVPFEVPAGISDDDLVQRLRAASIIEDSRVFRAWLFVWGGARARPGTHLLSDDLSPVQVLRRLRRNGEAAHVKVVFPEGWTRFEMARRLEDRQICTATGFLEATADTSLLAELGLPTSLPDAKATAEGWLFPAAYDFGTDEEPADVVRRMVGETRVRLERLRAAGLSQPPAILRRGILDVVVLASIIEKEAVMDDERPIIASVFLNRMQEPAGTGGRLQADPTAAYGCRVMVEPTAICRRWLATGSLRVNAEIQHDQANPYSTYTHPGLPPGPISNPSEKSLRAVLEPARTRFYYFVARGGGRHTFSETLTAHQAATRTAPTP